ncbi:leucine-rich repeats and immunoglobulin-like domains protein 1 [Limulus polyphemus]|uniref:Leucine-rich repeats and immunoglobulin-like domains protein 1 n=1 Tax=Limulus polyphemus TaxID=6850 RepID=A0ABM1S9Z3_LIMPO|nr:leucine-rich repeats and immunoglobulin-like domains protein 1 [Limulus polyphemus]XP_022240448.1 leucine-rich repeats and immunoglobulin-like domains protein 1 [Limulus polyphemus]XP_022240449.1 leucine-rich repeats and immunoglobulin-like domains protein 1 [Limulus polyphemus]
MATYLFDQVRRNSVSEILCFMLVYPVMALTVSLFKCPDSCACDDNGQFVSCIGDGLWHIPSDIPNVVKRLELRNYIILTLSAKAIENLTELQELKIQQSEIQFIENGTFTNLKKLRQLDVSLNLLQNIDYNTFFGLGDLTYLDLSSNRLTNIEGAFQHLRLVEQLNLRANKLTTITSESLTGLQNVQYLNMDSNNISVIEVGAFQLLNSLAHLILSNNPITSLSRLDIFGSRLQYIDVSNIGLKRVPSSLTRFVRDLRMAKNNLTHIGTGDFDSYSYLSLLILDDNNITKIENDAFGRLEYLARLWLNGNALEGIPSNLPSSLRALYIEENYIKMISAYSFRGLSLLERLFLQRNVIEKLEECAFCDLIQLKILDLQANNIQNLSVGIFANLSNLESLDISQNKLKYLGSHCFEELVSLKILQTSRISTFIVFGESVFDTLKRLEILEMYDSPQFATRILNSTRGLHGLRNLKELNIMHNGIISLRQDLPSFFPIMKVLKMSGNRLHCNQNILWLTEWMKTKTIQFYHRYDIRCASPTKLENKPIMMLTEKDFIITSPPPEIITVTERPESTAITNPSVVKIYSYGFLSPINFDPTLTNSTEAPTEDLFYEKSVIALFENRTNSTEFAMYRQIYSEEMQNKAVNDDNKDRIQNDLKHKSSESESSSSKYVKKPLSISVSSSHKREQNDEYTTHSPDPTKSNLTYPSFKSSVHGGSNANQNGILTFSENYEKFARTVDVAPTIKVYHRSFSTSNKSNLSSAVNTDDEKYHQDQTSATVLSSILAGGCLLAMTGLLIFVVILKYQKRPATTACNVRRSSSISYCPQRDEVAILTVSEGTVGLKTDTHYGLGNRLYYLMENGERNGEPNKDSTPDPQLQELLSETSEHVS